MSCPACSGTGWVESPRETKGGGLETAYYLCGCNAEGTPIPFPKLCNEPGCRAMVSSDAWMCPQHLAAYDAKAGAEEWGHAARFVGGLARVVATLGLPAIEEAMQDAVAHAEASKAFYEQERERLERRPGS